MYIRLADFKVKATYGNFVYFGKLGVLLSYFSCGSNNTCLIPAVTDWL